MGQISTKLASRLKKSRELAAELRREVKFISNSLVALSRGESLRSARGDVFDPLHTVYIAVQNVTSLFAERVSVFPEFQPYYELAAQAEEEYLPGGPPMSPL